jgi:AcrR family transcriptional regulator
VTQDGAEQTVAAAVDDPLRARLLAAAAEVFAEKGYEGTKIKDIVRAAGLSSGALYGRFDSREELLIEALVARGRSAATAMARSDQDIVSIIVDDLGREPGPLTDDEAMRVELYVAARRVPGVAASLREARTRQRDAIKPLVDRARRDGSVVAGADTESILYLLETVRLGLLLQRAAGFGPPDVEQWQQFVDALLRDVFTARHAVNPD